MHLTKIHGIGELKKSFLIMLPISIPSYIFVKQNSESEPNLTKTYGVKELKSCPVDVTSFHAFVDSCQTEFRIGGMAHLTKNHSFKDN